MRRRAFFRGRLRSATFRAGDLVVVRSKEEILATLTGGSLDGLPFMPQMFDFCGQQFQVFRRAHKTCDTVHGTGGRRMRDTVHLSGLRCDGATYGGCAAACLLFWKEAWLKPAAELQNAPLAVRVLTEAEVASAEGEVVAATRAAASTIDSPIYACQATQLPEATEPLHWWDVRQYAEDYTSGNVTLRELGGGLAYVAAFTGFRLARKLGAEAAAIRLYDGVQGRRGGVPFPRKRGTVPLGERTPSVKLGLDAGTPVRVRSHREILDTLDGNNRNRGLFFDAEEVPYCGQEHVVRGRVTQTMDERTGVLREVRGNTVILEETWCKGHYSDRRMFCPRAIYPFWRETWLQPVGGTNQERPAG